MKTKKFSYRRDSARRRLFRRSTSFKANDVITNRNPVCDFLLVNNTNLHHTVFQLSRSIGQIVAFDKGVPLINALVVGNICE